MTFVSLASRFYRHTSFSKSSPGFTPSPRPCSSAGSGGSTRSTSSSSSSLSSSRSPSPSSSVSDVDVAFMSASRKQLFQLLGHSLRPKSTVTPLLTSEQWLPWIPNTAKTTTELCTNLCPMTTFWATTTFLDPKGGRWTQVWLYFSNARRTFCKKYIGELRLFYLGKNQIRMLCFSVHDDLEQCHT